jgi:hypothetical protein
VVAVILGFLLTLALSVGVLLLVAMPHLKRGSRILTPDGERAVRHAQEQSRSVASAVQRGVVAAPNAVADMIRHAPEQRDAAGEASAAERTAAVEDAPEPVAEGIPAGEDVAEDAAPEPVSEPKRESKREPEPAPVSAAGPERTPAPEPVVPVVQPLPVITRVPAEPESGPAPKAEPKPEPRPEPKPEPEPVAEVRAKPAPKPEPDPEPEPEPEPEATPAARPGVGRQRSSPAISGPIRQPEGDGKLVKPPIKPSNKRHKTKAKSRRR